MYELVPMLVFASLLLPVSTRASEPCRARSTAQTIPLVELYTSEGCSSCPPADRWLSRHIDDVDTNYLAFHVDYWDSLGWPDRFASAAFSQRQRARVDAAGDDTVYTPQVMVGADVRASWGDDPGWQHVLELNRARPARAALGLAVARDGSGFAATLDTAPLASAHADAQVWLALYVDAQITAVRAGENRGATLHHDRVVRALFGPWPLGNRKSLRQVSLSAAPVTWGLTAFAQDRDGSILQSLSLAAAACR